MVKSTSLTAEMVQMELEMDLERVCVAAHSNLFSFSDGIKTS